MAPTPAPPPGTGEGRRKFVSLAPRPSRGRGWGEGFYMKGLNPMMRLRRATNSAMILALGAGLLGALTAMPARAQSVASMTLNSATVKEGQAATGTITLNAPAPAGGLSVTLFSPTRGTSLPMGLYFPAGANLMFFSVTMPPCSQNLPYVSALTSFYEGSSASASVTVTPIAVIGLTATPSTVNGGAPVSLTVTLDAPIPVGFPKQYFYMKANNYLP